MTDRELSERDYETMGRSFAAIYEQLPAPMRLLRLDGVVAGIAPPAPDRSVPNSVFYEDAARLEAALPQLAGAYQQAGVRAWTVWVPEGDRRARDLVAAAGHVLDAAPMGMGLELADLPPQPGPEPEWTGDWSAWPEACEVNDRAYGDPGGLFSGIWGELPEDPARHLYLARDGDEAVSFVMVCDSGEDCDFRLAATVPEARGRGLCAGLLWRALADARERGLATSTTEATRMGQPVYRRVGYRDVGVVEMWERRAPAPGA